MRFGRFGAWGLAVFPIYFAVVGFIGWLSRRRWQSANDYLNASRSLPTWVVVLAVLAYNCGSIEVIGMSAMAAQYGVAALDFYWVGGIPAMIFLGIVFLPIYMQTEARSLPEFLGLRFGMKVRLLNAWLSMAGAGGFAGIAIYAAAQVLHVILGWDLWAGALTASVLVLLYVIIGGLRGTIFTSVFQLFVMMAGLVPLFLRTIQFSPQSFLSRTERWRLWSPIPFLDPHAPLDCFGVVVGLSFVISFSYWSTDFVLIQRALTAHNVEAARKVPVLAGLGKLAFGPLIVLPGVAAPALLRGSPWSSFDASIPGLMSMKFGPVLLAVGASALLASLMAGLAGNISGFSALWTEEIYRNTFGSGRSEEHYIRTGRRAAVACFFIAILAAILTTYFRDLMEFLQLIAALLYAPVFSVIVAGILSRRVKEPSALAGIVSGLLAGLALQVGNWMRLIRFGSQMTADFYGAMLSFLVTILACFLCRDRSEAPAPTRFGMLSGIRLTPALAILSGTLLVGCLILNILWW